MKEITIFSKKGFTLIEIIFVIVIISILMTITMQFWSKRIDDLAYQIWKEQFITVYEKLYSQAATSNYYEWVRYDVSHITLSDGDNPISYLYDAGVAQPVSITTPLAISWLQLDAVATDHVNLDIQPYTLGCSMNTNIWEEIYTWSAISFSLIVKNQKQYCFSIENNTCRLIEKLCE